jgi:GrpB-like predicted nucleotidyltransferase (UPF0157 family)
VAQPPDPSDVEAYERWLDSIAVGGKMPPLRKPIEIHEYDPRWPALYAREEERVRSILGDRVLRIEHVGSTSVPGLPAKPVVDIVLEVADSADEAGYARDLEAGGYPLAIREPDWYEHRLFKGPDTNVNVHVFGAGCEELDRMIRFRDHLRASETDRELYAQAKRDLAARDWSYVQQYADAKTAIVREILARAG